MEVLTEGLYGFSYFVWISIISFSNQNHPWTVGIVPSNKKKRYLEINGFPYLLFLIMRIKILMASEYGIVPTMYNEITHTLIFMECYKSQNTQRSTLQDNHYVLYIYYSIFTWTYRGPIKVWWNWTGWPGGAINFILRQN
jgi:hypothetical protein